MRKTIGIFAISMIIMLTSLFSYAAEASVLISAAYSNTGVVGVLYNKPTDKRMRLLVEKDGTRYTYNVYTSEKLEQFPLQMGNGEYVVRLMENVEGNKYKEVMKNTIKVEIKDETEVFLNSIQEIKWDNKKKSIEKAKELTEGLTKDEDKVKAIYDYITSNIKYDYAKISKLTADYLPEIDSTLEGGQGICYDYSSLFAAMLRSVGVPAKMVKGYTTNVKEYHAWNEVYVNGKWSIIDTTVDAAYVQQNRKIEIYKSVKAYSAEKVF